MSVTPTYSGEVQFVTYADSSKGGPRITLRLTDRDELEAFVGKEAKRYMCVLVEIGDDERPVEKHKSEQFVPDKPKGGPLAILAGRWCADPKFQAWLGEELGEPIDAESAARVVREWCGVLSRAEIDSQPTAAERFHRLVRGPYSKHLLAMGAMTG